MAQLFGLLVGVARYHPDSHVPHLTGCGNDVRRMAEFIFKTFPSTPPDNITTLISEQATRAAVIDSFIAHLCDNPNIAAGDTVLFYYSGHGSRAPSAPEFRDLKEDSIGKDETLVLYDSRLPGSSDLADKELALLLSKINPAANIVVIADSCHSGSITRAIDDIKLGLPKFTVGDERQKGLGGYLTVHGKGYADIHPLSIPKPRHLALSACDRGEVAYETGDAGGLFTSTLLSVLNESRTKNSYAQLYENLYTELKRLSQQQTPQLFVEGGFNPGLLFLSDETGTGRPDYRAVYGGGVWTINYGALQGLDTDRRKLGNYRVALYKNREDKEPWTICSIARPGLEQSELDLRTEPQRNVDPKTEPQQKEGVYYADILNKTPSLTIYLKGDAEEKTAIYSLYEQSQERLPTIQLMPDLAETGADHLSGADYLLGVDNGNLVLTDSATGDLVHGVNGTDQASVDYILKALQTMEKWHRLRRLENKTRDFPEADVEWRLVYDSAAGPVICDASGITLDIREDHPKISYGFILKNNSSTPYYEIGRAHV